MKQTRRLKPDVRKEEILSAAVVLAEDKGYSRVTRDEVAAAIGVTGSAIQYHFGTMCQLHRDIMRHAVKCRNAKVVAQGLTVGDKYAAKADRKLKQQAVETILVDEDDG